ncbi:WXG100-like domain-containing protein, partial [Nocardia sp. NPDC003345]
MSIEIPPELQWLSYLAGASWPKGDEDALFALSQDWTDAANALLNELIPALRTACDTALRNYSGSGADQMSAQFDKFFAGDSSIESMAHALEQLADSVFDCGTQVEYAKLQIIITLAVMAIEIAYALASAWGAWAVPIIQATGAGVMRTIASRMASALAARATKMAQTPLWRLTAIQALEEAAIGFGIDALAQGIQLAQGHREEFDTEQAFVTAAVSGFAGAVAAPVGYYGGKYLGGVVSKHGPMTWWKGGLVAVGVGIPAGLVGAGASIVGVGVLTGNWEFDPAALVGGVGGGIAGGMHGVAGYFQNQAVAAHLQSEALAGPGGPEKVPPPPGTEEPPPYSDGSAPPPGTTTGDPPAYSDRNTSETRDGGSDHRPVGPAASGNTGERPVDGGSQRAQSDGEGPPGPVRNSRDGTGVLSGRDPNAAVSQVQRPGVDGGAPPVDGNSQHTQSRTEGPPRMDESSRGGYGEPPAGNQNGVTPQAHGSEFPASPSDDGEFAGASESDRDGISQVSSEDDGYRGSSGVDDDNVSEISSDDGEFGGSSRFDDDNVSEISSDDGGFGDGRDDLSEVSVEDAESYRVSDGDEDGRISDSEGIGEGKSPNGLFTPDRDRAENPFFATAPAEGVRTTNPVVQQPVPPGSESSSSRPEQPPRTYSTTVEVADGSANPFRSESQDRTSDTQDRPRPRAGLPGRNPFGMPFTANGTDQFRPVPGPDSPDRNPFRARADEVPGGRSHTSEDARDRSSPLRSTADPSRRDSSTRSDGDIRQPREETPGPRARG